MLKYLNRSLLLLPGAIIFLPVFASPKYFDRNAPMNFIFLCAAALVCAFLLIHSESINIARSNLILVFALIAGTLLSFLLNSGKISMLTGDTGRYTGLISLYGLILISISYTQIALSKFQAQLDVIIFVILAVNIIGALQFLGIIDLPTGAGIGSTLGNTDFLSAWIGTSLPLILLVTLRDKLLQYLLQASLFLLSLSLLWVIDVKQGVVDLIIFVGLLLFWLIIKNKNFLALGKNLLTGVISVSTIIWFELIFLLPMLKLKIPFFIDDLQVTIRTHFWNAGIQMFFDHLGFGVGPDNYGNFYEQYRSLDSFKMTEFVLSNDAHSSLVQSFATLGLVNIFIFLLLWVSLVSAWVTCLYSYKNKQKLFLLLGAYILIFATNSMISPITLPNKFIFWAIIGFVFGAAARAKKEQITGLLLTVTKLITVALAAMIAIVSLNFTLAIKEFTQNLNLVATAPNKISYQYTPYLPCVIYFPAQLELAAANGQARKLDLANRQLIDNPRCIQTQLLLAQTALNNKEFKPAKQLIENLLAMAPARREVISIAATYALAANDKQMQSRLIAQSEFLGILPTTKSEPQSPPK